MLQTGVAGERIYVQRNQIKDKGANDKRDKEIDVFSKDGYFLFKTTLPANTCVIRDGYIYQHALDEEEGGEYVKRYRIRNWDLLKRGIYDYLLAD